MAVDYTVKASRIMVYTRKTTQDEYSDGLARSIHLAYSTDGMNYEAMNGNYGILFAQGDVRADDTICPKGVKAPGIWALPQGGFVIASYRVNENGSNDVSSAHRRLFWTTQDLIHFRELGLLERSEAIRQGFEAAIGIYEDGVTGEIETGIADSAAMEEESIPSPEASPVQANRYEARSEARSAAQSAFRYKTLPEGAAAGNTAEVSRSLCDRAVLYWSRLYSVRVQVPERIVAPDRAAVEAVHASVVYSDGSTAEKQVKWDVDHLDFNSPGTHRITGTVMNEQYSFPLARGYGDPVVFLWEGRYYFIATNDNCNDVGLYMREAQDVAGLFTEETQQHLILALDESRGLIQTFWAPEFHVIGGELYILFAVSGTKWGPQCHLMKWKEGTRLTDPESWEDPVRICRQDGRPLAEDGITLDMTYLKTGERSYYIWSYRRHIGTQLDTGSMLYIAAVDENTPWQLAGEPVLLSRPLYGWENVNHTINNEGPYAFTAGGKVYLTYSGGASDAYTYVLGLLTADLTADLLDINVWSKRCTPVLSYYSVEGEYGPGHNSFFTDALGNLMIAYHAEDSLHSHLRCDAIRRVHFDIQGEPVFDLSAQRDLDPALAGVEMEVTTGLM